MSARPEPDQPTATLSRSQGLTQKNWLIATALIAGTPVGASSPRQSMMLDVNTSQLIAWSIQAESRPGQRLVMCADARLQVNETSLRFLPELPELGGREEASLRCWKVRTPHIR